MPLTLHLTPDAERAIRFGHPWVYAEGVAPSKKPGRTGDLAAVYDRRNRFLALGLYDAESPIRIRILQRHAPAPITAAWFRERLLGALAAREARLGDPDTTGWRLVHGENDGLPGLVVDQYDATLVLKLYTGAWGPHLPAVLEALAQAAPSERVVLRLSRQAQKSPAMAAWRNGQVVAGAALTSPVIFRERGLRFAADVVRGQKTGFFLDQRDNRAQVERASRGRRVLDVFAYTGAFALSAARGGASHVTSVEESRAALAAAERQARLNKTVGGIRHASFTAIVGDAFAVLARLAKRRRTYDMVILDPPSFAKSQAEVPRALAAYRRLAELALAALPPEGLLVYACCSGHVPEDAFFAAVHQAARAKRRTLRERARTRQPFDHPVTFPEGAYLKCLFATVVG